MSLVRCQSIFLAALLSIGIGGVANGGVIIFDYSGQDFSGGGATITEVIARLTLDDMAAGLSKNEVRGTLEFGPNGDLGVGIDKISSLYLNLVDDSFRGNIEINGQTPLGTYKSFKNGGKNISSAGDFDLELNLSTSAADKFSPGDTFIFDLQLVDTATTTYSPNTLTSASFNALSTGGSSAFRSVIHLNLTGNGESGKYADIPPVVPVPAPNSPVPEPASLAVWSVVLMVGGFGASRRRKPKQSS